MAFTAQLGTSSSQLGNIEPGQGAVEQPTTRFGPGSSNTTPNFTQITPAFNGQGVFTTDPFIQSRASGAASSLAYSSNVTAGSTLVMAFGRVDNTSRVTNVTDTLGNNWVNTGSNFVAQGQYVTQWAAFNIASGGANTVSISGTSGQMSIWELALGPNAQVVGQATGSESSGTSHSTSSITSTGFRSVMVESAQFTGIGTGSAGTNFNHVQNGIINFFAQQGKVSNFGSSNGPWTTNISAASANLMVMYTDQPSVGVGTATVTFSGSASGFPVFEGGDILLEDGTNLLLEDGTNALLESTADGGAGSASITFSVSGVAVPLVTGSGGIIVPTPSFNGSGIWSLPQLSFTQSPVEDLEASDVQFLAETQLTVEDLEEYDLPIESMTQIAAEDLEMYDLPVLSMTQIVVEILIPFDCDLTPPLTLPPGCPPDEIEGDGSNSAGCADTPATGSGTSKAGCKPTFRN